MNKCKLLIFSLFVAKSVMVTAQDSWTRLAPDPQENTLNCVIKIPGTNKIAAVGEGSTVMISDDSGESWDLILNPAGMNNDFKIQGVFFNNESSGFIFGGNESILKTTDGGNHWQVKYSGAPNDEAKCINDVFFVNEITGLAVAGQGQLLKTTDAGETWIPIQSGAAYDLSKIVFAGINTGFILGNGPLLKTTDSGENWEIINNPTGLPGCSEMYFQNDAVGFAFSPSYSADSGSIYKTSDSGLTWRKVHSDYFMYTCKFSFMDDLHGIAGSYTYAYSAKIYITSDAGETWTGYCPSAMPWFSVGSICATGPTSAVTVGRSGMIFRTNDRGLSWEPGFDHPFWSDITEMQFLNRNTGYTLSYNLNGGVPASIFNKTNDGGSTWTEIAGNYVTDFFFLSEDTGFYTTAGVPLLFMTMDGGVTWAEKETGFDFYARKVKFFDASNGLILGDDHLIRTSDGGNTWNVIWEGSWGGCYDIEYLTKDTVFILISDGFECSLFKSNDGGISWEENLSGDIGPARDIIITANHTMYLPCGDQILKSTDGGNTWYSTVTGNQNPIEFRSVYFPSADTGYAVGKGLSENMMKTTDGGETWFTIETAITSGLSFVYFNNNQEGLVFGDNGIEAKTTDGGVVGINQPGISAATDSFDLYPDPARDVLNICIGSYRTLPETTISIYDITGKTVYSSRVLLDSSKIQLPVSDLRPGLYIIKLAFPDGFMTSKFVKL